MDAGIGFERPRFVLDVSALHVDDIKNVPLYLPELLPSARNLKSDGTIVAGISDQQQSDDCSKPDNDGAFHHFLGVACERPLL